MTTVELYIYDIHCTTHVHTIPLVPGFSMGVLALSNGADICYAAYPGESGTVNIFDVEDLVVIAKLLSSSLGWTVTSYVMVLCVKYSLLRTYIEQFKIPSYIQSSPMFPLSCEHVRAHKQWDERTQRGVHINFPSKIIFAHNYFIHSFKIQMSRDKMLHKRNFMRT